MSFFGSSGGGGDSWGGIGGSGGGNGGASSSSTPAAAGGQQPAAQTSSSGGAISSFFHRSSQDQQQTQTQQGASSASAGGGAESSTAQAAQTSSSGGAISSFFHRSSQDQQQTQTQQGASSASAGGGAESSTAQGSSSGGGLLGGIFGQSDPADLHPNDVAETLGVVVVTREEAPDSRHVSDLQPGIIFRVTNTGPNSRVQIKAEPGTGAPAITGWTSTKAHDGQGIVRRLKESDAATKLLVPYQPGGRCEVKATTQARREKSHKSAVSGSFDAGEALQILDKQGSEVLLQSDKVVGWVTGVTAEGGLALAPIGAHEKYGSGSGIMGSFGSWTSKGKDNVDTKVAQDVLLTGGGTPKGLANSSQDPFMSASGRAGGAAPQASADAAVDPFLSARGRAGGAAPQASTDAAVDPFLSRGADAGPANANRRAKAVRVDTDPLLDRGPSQQVPPDQRQHTDVNPFLTSAQIEQATSAPMELNNDPFLSHAPVPRTLANDPFNTQTRRSEPRPIQQDPFLSQQLPCSTDAAPKTLQEDPFLTMQMPFKQDRLPLDVTEDTFLKEPGQLNVPRELQNDPFLTHARKDPGRDEDPFLVRDLVHEAPRYTENVTRDPFLASHREIPKENKVRKCCRNCGASARRSVGFCGMQAGNCWTFFLSGKWLSGPKRACGLCGEEIDAVEPDMVLRPWCVFMTVLLCGLLLRHFSLIGYIFVVLLFAAGPASLIIVGLTSARTVNPLLVKASLPILLAVLTGARAASFGWNFYARQYWWMQTGQPMDGDFTRASTPPESRVDAAWIRFPDRNFAMDMRQSDTQVDTSRSAGHQDGKMYCVAPILSNDVLTSGPLIPVNYWAIGTDCCEQSGSGFTCDATRQHKALYGVVVLGQLPCLDCELYRFQEAITKAEALYGMAGSNQALLVRYVSDPYDMRTALGWRIVLLVVILAIASFIVFTALGVALRGARWDHLYGGMTAPVEAIKARKAAFIP